MHRRIPSSIPLPPRGSWIRGPCCGNAFHSWGRGFRHTGHGAGGSLQDIRITDTLGIIGGFLADRAIEHFQIERRKVSIDIEEHTEIVDYFKKHVYNHIIKQHIPRLFIWIFLTLTIIELMMQRFDLASIISNMPTSSLIIFAALVGIIPESGPHMIFLVLYSKGLIPFSVLLVSTLSQDGHGLLPLLSHSVKDTIHVQIFTTIFSLIVGFLVILVSNII